MTQSAAELKTALLDMAKRMEGPFESVIRIRVEAREKNPSGNPWSIVDSEILDGKFTPETKEAYKRWRAASIAEETKK